MLYDGKIQALNAAIEELLPHLWQAPVQIEIIGFALDVTPHQSLAVQTPEPFEPIAAVAQGPTETGRAISYACDLLEPRSGMAGLLLITDGRPTDLLDPTYAQALSRLDSMGAGLTRNAMGIGRDIDLEVLEAFTQGRAGAVSSDPMALAGQLLAGITRKGTAP